RSLSLLPSSTAPSALSSRLRLPPTPTLFPYTTLFRSRPIAGRNAHSSADIWSQSAASSGQDPNRRGSVYERTSFHPSEIATFQPDRKSTRLNSSHVSISYAVFCLKKKKKQQHP